MSGIVHLPHQTNTDTCDGDGSVSQSQLHKSSESLIKSISFYEKSPVGLRSLDDTKSLLVFFLVSFVKVRSQTTIYTTKREI